jgi:hypothetical protein
MPRDFTFEEAAIVVICLTVGLLGGLASVFLLVRLL